MSEFMTSFRVSPSMVSFITVVGAAFEGQPASLCFRLLETQVEDLLSRINQGGDKEE